MSYLHHRDHFQNRHIGIRENDLNEMLRTIGVSSLDELIDQTVPAHIRMKRKLHLPEAQTEYEYLNDIKKIAAENKVYRSYIGMGYYSTITPAVIRRNILENPGWYTQYTPYQAEISQGRLEALLNFQTMVSDLTGLPVANASLLDEGTAAAEAMHMFWGLKNKKGSECNKFFVSADCFPQTIDVIRGRAAFLGIEVVVGDFRTVTITGEFFGALLQYPAKDGNIYDYTSFVERCKQAECFTCVATDLLALTLLTPPGEFGADCAVGNSQRFGVPMGYGGPHAAFFATRDEYKRSIPGRIIGVSIDAEGKPALRMALQTREQHIRREKATSNICTAQALLAIMAGMYGVYHGPQGLRHIALRIYQLTAILKTELTALGYRVTTLHHFDTITVAVNDTLTLENIRHLAIRHQINFFYGDKTISISLDETTALNDVADIVQIFAQAAGNSTHRTDFAAQNEQPLNWPENLVRKSAYLTHPVFNSYHSETRLMRYIKSLENKDLSLTTSMIPLGSCTMKLNAAAELEPITWSEFANIHPFVPADQAEGYHYIISSLEKYLCEITGFAAASLQPNSGAQGEYAGLQVIRAYQRDRGEGHRDVALIPASAHGTNPASAVMCGLKVVVVATDKHGNIDFDDLLKKAEEHKDRLCCLMVTYPSTHGVFESKIKDVCDVIHAYGGQVYMDGANLNAQVGLTSPAIIGADVNHINLHKTFAIPHGGGGPGMGPICVAAHLAPYLPGHPLVKTGGEKALPAVSAAPYGSASILLISYGYIRMLGSDGVTNATRYAILNANYIKARLEPYYDVLYVGKEHGRCAHELILDFRPFKHSVGIEVEDVAKRLMDYGFHAPTVSFPVPGTLMIEPTESEDKAELDRFCDALISIRREIEKIERGEISATDNPLKNAPHTLSAVTCDTWNRPYSRSEAAYPLPYLRQNKFWPSVARVNNSHGDRNLICTCPPVESYAAVT
ncbi:MAG: aminomethyl-transferring glycine dehydrogenase [Chitinophagales bacterium]|nr:aminomethyl-transferring glycine dehydrogenase [Chitinophagales bacterium]MDW8419445.1 aminomethyl-transferring glycine dehydrogenase [Chitinophagales bacterium]